MKQKCLLYELTMMREVSHPSLLEILEIYEGDNNIYCLGKLYSGDSLSTVINDKKQVITETHVKAMAFKMLQALSYLETKSIIHRDLKPENIVFSSKGSLEDPVLIDLGFATFEKDFRLLFSRCGTPGYVAPEVLHDKDYTCKADIFSLGVGGGGDEDHLIHDGDQDQPVRPCLVPAADPEQPERRGRPAKDAERPDEPFERA